VTGAPWLTVQLWLAQAPPEHVREHVQQMSEQVGAGRIVGGWSYVWTCYAIAWIGMALYAVSLWARGRGRKDLSP
jgi:hypothetical protein